MMIFVFPGLEKLFFLKVSITSSELQYLVCDNLKATVIHKVMSETWTSYFNFDTCSSVSASVFSINIVFMWYLNSYTKEWGCEVTEKTKQLYCKTNRHLS